MLTVRYLVKFLNIVNKCIGTFDKHKEILLQKRTTTSKKTTNI